MSMLIMPDHNERHARYAVRNRAGNSASLLLQVFASASVLVASALWPCGLLADARLAIEASGGLPAATVYVRDGQIRLEPRDEAGQFALFAERSQSLVVVDQQRRQYIDVTPAALARVRAATGLAQQALEVLRGPLDSLPAEQRRSLEDQLAALGLPSASAPTSSAAPVLAPVSSGRREVSGIPCSLFDITQASRQVAEICIADPRNLGLPAQDAATLKGFVTYASGLARQAVGNGRGFQGEAVLLAVTDIDGVPIAAREHEGGASAWVARVSQEPVSPELFRVPPDYRAAEWLAPPSAPPR